MNKSAQPSRQQEQPLYKELKWFIRLRWLAGGVVILLSILGKLWGQDPASPWILVMGIGFIILVYNGCLLLALEKLDQKRNLIIEACLHIFFDLACLTFLVVVSGKWHSPLLFFYVFHMVFASILLPRQLAYTAALTAIAIVMLGLLAVSDLPVSSQDTLVLLCWMSTLFLTVHLTNHTTRTLKRHRRRIINQNRRIRRMNKQLQDQQASMIQHEKAVALGQLAAGITHEIANPLANMDSVLQLLQRHPERDRPNSIVTLRQQVERIRIIIDQLTRFAHPTETNWQVCGMDKLVDNAREVLQYDKRFMRVKMTVDICSPCCMVRVQPHAIQQVLVNVIINAMDALEHIQDPEISISTQCLDHECIIYIKDNGPGIDPSIKSRIFDPFFTTKPVGKGTGLGLAISQCLIRNQGGDIKFDTHCEQGTCINIHMPRFIDGENS